MFPWTLLQDIASPSEMTADTPDAVDQFSKRIEQLVRLKMHSSKLRAAIARYKERLVEPRTVVEDWPVEAAVGARALRKIAGRSHDCWSVDCWSVDCWSVDR